MLHIGPNNALQITPKFPSMRQSRGRRSRAPLRAAPLAPGRTTPCTSACSSAKGGDKEDVRHVLSLRAPAGDERRVPRHLDLLPQPHERDKRVGRPKSPDRCQIFINVARTITREGEGQQQVASGKHGTPHFVLQHTLVFHNTLLMLLGSMAWRHAAPVSLSLW
jgi:hypothetical protein